MGSWSIQESRASQHLSMNMEPLPKAVRASLVARSNCSAHSSMLLTILIPRPPPPYAALEGRFGKNILEGVFTFRMTGQPCWVTKATACSAVVTASSVPGMMGRPAAMADCRAATWQEEVG